MAEPDPGRMARGLAAPVRPQSINPCDAPSDPVPAGRTAPLVEARAAEESIELHHLTGAARLRPGIARRLIGGKT